MILFYGLVMLFIGLMVWLISWILTIPVNRQAKMAERKLFPSTEIGKTLTDEESMEVEKAVYESSKGTFANRLFSLYMYFNLPGAIILVAVTQGEVEEFKQWQNLLATSVVYWILFVVIHNAI